MLIPTLFCFNFNVGGPYGDLGVFGVENGGYRYGFQGQEKDDEIKGEGNSVNYKYRMHDVRIGRFFAVDPMYKEYSYYSPYVFSGNEVIAAVELEGLQPYRLFNSPDEAAANFGQQYNPASILEGREYGTNIYAVHSYKDDYTRASQTHYYYEEPNKGTKDGVTVPQTWNNKGVRVATAHTHGEYIAPWTDFMGINRAYENNNFSKTDKENAEERKVNNYVVTPNGSLRRYNYSSKFDALVRTDMPSDPKDPTQLNDNDVIPLFERIKKEEEKNKTENLIDSEIQVPKNANGQSASSKNKTNTT